MEVTHVQVDELLKQEVVERRHPIQFVRGDAQIDRHALGAQLAQIEVAFFRRRINAGIEPQTELGRDGLDDAGKGRSEEPTSELQSLMRNSYAVFCLNKKTSQ